jgi:membrane protease YdiL (CAAX protease family)
MQSYAAAHTDRRDLQLAASVAAALGGTYLLGRYLPRVVAAGGSGVWFAAITALLLGLTLTLAQLDQPTSWRRTLGLSAFDWRGALAGLGLFAAFSLAEQLILGAALASISGALIGIGLTPSLSFYGSPQTPLALLLLPAAEELYFRGYVQRSLQRRIGRTGAWLLATLIWSLWHVWAPQELVRRLLAGLCVEALLFRWRQNTWPSLIVHTSRVVARAALG